MPSFEYSAWLTIKADTRQEANKRVEDIQQSVEDILGEFGSLSIDDSEPIEEDDDDDV